MKWDRILLPALIGGGLPFLVLSQSWYSSHAELVPLLYGVAGVIFTAVVTAWAAESFRVQNQFSDFATELEYVRKLEAYIFQEFHGRPAKDRMEISLWSLTPEFRKTIGTDTTERGQQVAK